MLRSMRLFQNRAIIVWSMAILMASIAMPGSSTVHAEEKPEIFVQMGHSDGVSSVAFSADGRYAVSGSHDNTIKLWEVSTGREIRTFQDSSFISSVAFSPDGKSILAGNLDNLLKLWDISTGTEIRRFQGHTSAVNSVAFSPDGRYALSGSDDKTLKLWESATGKEVRTFKGHASWFSDKGEVFSVAFSPDGKYAVSGSKDKTAKLWEIATGKEIRTFKGHSGTVHSVAFSPDGMHVLSASEDDTLRLWEIATGREVRSFQGHTKDEVKWGVKSAAISPDNRYVLFSVSIGSELKLFELSTGKEVRTLPGHSSWTNSVVFSPDGRYALSGSHDSTVKLWELSTGKEVRTFQGYSNGISSAAFSPDGRYALSGNWWESDVKLWEISTGRQIKTFKSHSKDINSVTFSPDGRFVLSGSDDNTLKLWETGTGKEIKTFQGHSKSVNSVAFSSDGRYALSGSDDRTVKLWDVSTGKEIRTFQGHSELVMSVAFSPDGRYVLSASRVKNPLKLWDISTGMEVPVFQRYSGWINSVAFSPDGKYALTGSWSDNTVRILEVATGNEIWAFRGHSGLVNSVAFSPDGRYALSGSKDNTVKLLDISKRKEVRTFKGHSGSVNSVAFSPDGKYALSGDASGSIILWNVATGAMISMTVAFSNGEWIVITPEGYFNASPKGAENLNVRIGNNVYGIDQFYAKFYRSELVQLALAGKEVLKGETFGDILVKKPAPTVRIVSPATGSSVDKDSITVSLKITDNGGGIGNVNIYLNGSQVANETRGVIVEGTGSVNEKILSFTIPLIDGQNEIRAVAFNKDNSMESNPALVSVLSRAVLQKPNLYALVIGINEYKNKSISLNYAVSDAMAFAETLKKTAAPLFGKTDVQVLTTPDATTKEAITKAFEELRMKIKPNDLFVFYDASHGVVDVVDDEEQYFLLTSNVLLLSSRHIGKDAMGQKELAKLVGNIPAQKKLVILDTCNAGKGGKEIQVALLQQTRGLTESTAVKLLQRAIGSSVFSASSDTQQALEGYKGHGLFTFVLMEGLQGKADIKKDGYITVLGLADYVEEQVTRLSEEVFKRQQTPTIQTGANFPIGKVK